MGLIVTQKSTNSVPPLESGVYTGICVGVVDLGEQHNQKFNKYQYKILFIFEIVDEFVDVDGEQKPRWLSKEFTASSNQKSNLYQVLTSWIGRALTDEELENGFDVSTMLKAGCQLQVLQEDKDGRSYNVIQAIIGLPKGAKVSEPISDIVLFDMDHEDAPEVFETLPDWMKDKIMKSTTWAQKNANSEDIDIDTGVDGETPSETPTAPKEAMETQKKGPGF